MKEARKMKREVLFEAVRDEQGDLSLKIARTEIEGYMPIEFWKGLIKRCEKSTESDKYFDKADLIRKGKIVEMLKQGIADQEKEEKAEMAAIEKMEKKIPQEGEK